MDKFILNTNEKKIVNENIRLAYWKANIWIKKIDNPNLIDEFISCCELGLIKAVHTFDSTKKINFSTYASTCMDNEIRVYLRKYNRGATREIPFTYYTNPTYNSPDDEICFDRILKLNYINDNIPEDTIIKHNNTLLIKNLINKLPMREKIIIKMYYIKNMNEYEISKIIGLSQTYVSRLRRRSLEKLKIILASLINRDIY